MKLNLLALAATICSLAVTSPLAASGSPGSQYVEDTLVAWTGQPAELLHPWALAIAGVCADRDECDMLASLGQVETRWLPWVLDGSCNSEAWRRAHRKDKVCDGGFAVGPWQLHETRGGAILRGAGPEAQAYEAVRRLRRRPEAWTTWRAAQAQAAWWRLHRPQ
jgi:hypothetical protein